MTRQRQDSDETATIWFFGRGGCSRFSGGGSRSCGEMEWNILFSHIIETTIFSNIIRTTKKERGEKVEF